MGWTIQGYDHANHNPVAEVNSQGGAAPILVEAEVGRPITLNASTSRDPDGNALRYLWFHYPEAGAADGNLAEVTITGADSATAIVTPTAACRPQWLPRPRPCPVGVAHIILIVTDDGAPALTSYRRIILTVHAGKR